MTSVDLIDIRKGGVLASRLEVVYREALRRRLVQTAALYVAVAWGGTEILVFLSDSLSGESIAVEVRRYLAVLLIAGFPAAMYLAWTRDLGLQARRLVGAGAVVLLVSAILIASIPEPTEVVKDPAGDNTLAIFPFEVCEDRQGDKPLAGGLTRAVFTRLAQRDHVKVKGRASVQTVLESSPTDAVAANLLRTKYMLKGTVCRDGLDLGLHAELVDDKGFVVWGEDYTQAVNQAGQVEQRLATLVENGVAAELGDVVVTSDDLAVDRSAHEQLLIGHGYREQGDRDNARVSYESALEYQPDYAEAVFGLAMLEGDRLDRKPVLDKARRLALAALERNPHDYDATIVAARIEHKLGWFEATTYMDIEETGEEEVLLGQERRQSHFAEAERLARAALTANPAATDVRMLLVTLMEHQGIEHRKQTLMLLEQGLDREPWDRNFTKRLAYRLAEFGRVQEAMDLIDRFYELPQGKKDLWFDQLEILQTHGLFYHGRTGEKLAYLIDLAKSDPDQLKNSIALMHLWWSVAEIARLGLYDEAARLHVIAERFPNPEDTASWNWMRDNFLVGHYENALAPLTDDIEEPSEKCASKSNEEILSRWSIFGLGCAYEFLMAGDEDRPRKLLEALQYEPPIASFWAEREFDNDMFLGWLYLYLDLNKEAEKVFRGVRDGLELLFEEGVRHPHTLGQLAEVRYRTSDTEGAVEMLHRAIDEGIYDLWFCCEDYLTAEIRQSYESSTGFLKFLNAYWADELAGDPEIELARSRMRAIIDNQRAHVLALLEHNDLEGLLARLVDNEAAD
ncbi:MAG: tetratricopeptide repeat protein [Gammaproteobacteria bacterium]